MSRRDSNFTQRQVTSRHDGFQNENEESRQPSNDDQSSRNGMSVNDASSDSNRGSEDFEDKQLDTERATLTSQKRRQFKSVSSSSSMKESEEHDDWELQIEMNGWSLYLKTKFNTMPLTKYRQLL